MSHSVRSWHKKYRLIGALLDVYDIERLALEARARHSYVSGDS